MRWLLLAVALLTGCSSRPDPQVVDRVDLNRYQGTWYEIARFDMWFQRGMSGCTATYTLRPDGRITVLNAGLRDGQRKTAEGVAWVPDPSQPGKLKVQFFWPFSGAYWILALDPEYRWVVIGHPSREYLWYLARDPVVTPEVRARMDAVARENGYDLTPLITAPP